MGYCKVKDCKKYGIFGLGSDKFYCKEHKSPDMVDLRNKKCEYVGCSKNPLFNYKGLSKRFCNEHKLDGMVNVVHRYCIVEGCLKQSSYNIKGSYADYCLDHKTDEMELVVYKNKCKYPDCNIRASYNYPSKINCLYCTEHKLDGMVSKSKKCEAEGCLVSSNYNIEGETFGRFCATHKLPDMIEVASAELRHCKLALLA